MTRWPPRPSAGADFFKAHGLGNDYLVFEEGASWEVAPASVASVCDRYRGVGGDGIVVLLGGSTDDFFRARMFNPDGSEFERSGNGLRVLAAYLARTRPGLDAFRVEVGGAVVRLVVHGRQEAVLDVSVEMGRAHTGAEAVALDPAALDDQGWMEGPSGAAIRVVPVSVGNPHLVVLSEPLTESNLERLGSFLVAHPALAHGANVQLAALDASGVPTMLDALVWERGVGPTSASGTSACAVAVAAVRAGWADPSEIGVRMPGGVLTVTVSETLDVVLRGPVEDVCSGRLLRNP